MVFTGQYLNDWYCKNCNAKRFTNCKYCSKSFNSYQYECPHNTRIPFKKLKYRSIKSIICNLIRYDFFRFLINYTYYDMNKYINSDLKHWDIKDSEIYKKNYDEMKIYFNKQYDNIENKPIMINILSQFYDGCAVFRNKVTSFHPLLIINDVDNMRPIMFQEKEKKYN